MGRGLALLILVIPFRPLVAQRQAELVFRRAEVSYAAEREARAPDYRYEGLGIGVGVGALIGVLGGFAICHQSDVSCGSLVPLTGLAGAAIFGFTGLMIGGAFDKPGTGEVPASADSTGT